MKKIRMGERRAFWSFYSLLFAARAILPNGIQKRLQLYQLKKISFTGGVKSNQTRP
jgi:hypothetical protein